MVFLGYPLLWSLDAHTSLVGDTSINNRNITLACALIMIQITAPDTCDESSQAEMPHFPLRQNEE